MLLCTSVVTILYLSLRNPQNEHSYQKGMYLNDEITLADDEYNIYIGISPFYQNYHYIANKDTTLFSSVGKPAVKLIFL